MDWDYDGPEGAGPQNQNVVMKACDGTTRQLWSMKDGERIKVENSQGIQVCMDWDYDGPNPLNVWAHECHDGDNQKWYFVGQQLKSRHDSTYCLDWDVGSINGGDGFNIYMHKCDTEGLSSQHWFKAEYDSGQTNYDKELTLDITTCADTFSASQDPFSITVNEGSPTKIDTYGDKENDGTDPYTIRYTGVLDT